jgi:hypothetical protein
MATDDDADDDDELHHVCYLSMPILACGRRMYALIMTLNSNMGLRPQSHNHDQDDGDYLPGVPFLLYFMRFKGHTRNPPEGLFYCIS